MLRRLAAGVALVAALALAGCTPPEPTESTTPVATPTTSTIPSEPALLSEARAAWDAYQRQLSQLGTEPGSATIDQLLQTSEPEHAAFLLGNFERAASARVHTEGSRTTASFEPSDFADAPESIRVAVCVDLTDERLVGDEGEDLTPPDRDESQSLLATFSLNGDRYLVSNVEEYQDAADPCL